MKRSWSGERVLDVVRGFQPACVLAAGAELDVFGALAKEPLTAEQLAQRLRCDERAMRMLADALVAMELLSKRDGHYGLVAGAAEILTEAGEASVVAMVRHLANCLRSWAQLAAVVRSGQPAERGPSIRGAEGDREAFIEAMNDISRSAADPLVEAIGPPRFKHLLDLGGGPGTWTIAFLRRRPQARATLFDRAEVIPLARKHITAAGLAERVRFAGGDFQTDEALPGDADLAWLGAVVHMNSRQQNRALFGKVLAALQEGGSIMIRDVVMDQTRTEPAGGAMFAINMLVNTPGGGTYTFGELSEDLVQAGFSEPLLLHRGEFMDSIVQAKKTTTKTGR